MHLQPYVFSLEWNGLLLAYLEGSWIIMLSSALIGCFTVRLNVELCSDSVFHCVAHFTSSQGEKYIFQYFLALLYCWVIILYIKCGHQGAAINMRVTETTFKNTIDFYFHFRDRTNSVYTMEKQYLTHISGSVNHSSIILSHLSLLCLCGKWNIMYCNRLQLARS